MPFNIIAFGQRVKYYRLKRGFSQSYLSELIHVTPPYISYIENGDRSSSLETLVNLANVLDVTADELLKDSLDRASQALQNEFAAILSDCTKYEMTILMNVLVATKDALRTKR